jgi:DNA-binding NtrC family response regulator
LAVPLVGNSDAIRDIRDIIARIGPTNGSVLISGEGGTGKALVARAIHAASPRRGRRFFVLDCQGMGEQFIEDQLFGSADAARTGSSSPGVFVAADLSTLFIDEVADLPLTTQAKLLRAIDQKAAPLGAGADLLAVDVRIVVATARDLEAEVANGRFRRDLLYRLNVVTIALPPLRERRQDIPLLAEHIIDRVCARLGTARRRLAPETLRLLIGDRWPGNVTALENVLERAIVLGDGPTILPDHLPEDITPPEQIVFPGSTLKEATRRFQREHLLSTIKLVGDDKTAAAQLLRISLASLYRKLGELARD